MKRLVTIILGIALLLIGCGDDKAVTPTPEPEQLMYLDEAVFIAASGEIEGTIVSDHEVKFDISSDSLYINGEFNDFQVKCSIPSTKEEEFSIYNVTTATWDQYAPQESPPYAIRAVLSCQRNSLSAAGLTARDYVDSDGTVRIKSKTLNVRDMAEYTCGYKIQLLKLHPLYRALPLKTPEGYNPERMTFDGEHFWVYESHPPAIYKFDRRGELVLTIPLLSGGVKDICADEENLWVLGQGVIVRLDFHGNILNQIPVSEMAYHYRICADNNDLVLLWGMGISEGIRVYDIDSTIFYSELRIRSFRELPHIPSYELLSVESGRITFGSRWSYFTMNPDSSLSQSRPFLVDWVTGMSIVGDTMWLLHREAPESGTHATVVSPFLLRN